MPTEQERVYEHAPFFPSLVNLTEPSEITNIKNRRSQCNAATKFSKKSTNLEIQMFKKILNTAVLATAVIGLLSSVAVADVIDDIKARGTLIVGTKADYRPYGYRDPTGEIVGLEPELAKTVADKLGVKLELVPVVGSNRMEFLKQGKIDLLIATMTDNPKRGKVVNIVKPNYYSSGTNLLAWKKANFKGWADLKGKTLCAIQGGWYNKKMQQEYGAKITAFKGVAEVMVALEQGSCMAFVYDDSWIVGKLKDSAMSSKFEMPLETIDDAAWGLAVNHGEDAFYAVMAEIIADWHKSGLILKLENKYGIENTPFALRMNEEFK